VIQRAFAENRILITNDKDFGEKVYREQLPHKGVILLRLADERSAIKIDVLESTAVRSQLYEIKRQLSPKWSVLCVYPRLK
jgi:predicted nuclease of predicted toxin-antitoxin system